MSTHTDQTGGCLLLSSKVKHTAGQARSICRVVRKPTHRQVASGRPPQPSACKRLSGPAEPRWCMKARRNLNGRYLCGHVAGTIWSPSLRPRHRSHRQAHQRPWALAKHPRRWEDHLLVLARQHPSETPVHRITAAGGAGQGTAGQTDGLAQAALIHPMVRPATPTIHLVVMQ